MGLPRAVQQQIDEAAEIQADLIADNNKTEVLATVDDTTEAVPANKPEPVPEKPAKTADESKDDLRNQLAVSNDRFKTYKKMYDKEVHEFRTDKKDLAQKVESLNEDIKALQEKLDATETIVPEEKDSEEIEAIKKEFGADFVNAVSNLSGTQLIKQNASLNKRIESMEKLLANGETTQSSAKDFEGKGDTPDFFTALSEHFPNWNNVNKTQGFKEWLDTADINGQPKQVGLKMAQDKGDAVKVATYFWDYTAENPNRNNGGDYLPDSDSGGDSIVESGEMVSRDFIQVFYREKMKGMYSPDEIKSIEAKINHAVSNNMVV